MHAEITPEQTSGADAVAALIVLGKTDEAATIEAILRTATPSVSLVCVDSVSEIEKLKADSPILALERPAWRDLHDALETGVAPAHALATWIERAECRLRFFRRNRRRVTVVNTERLEQGDPKLLEALSERLSVTFRPRESSYPKAHMHASAATALVSLIGASLINTSDTATMLRAELESMLIGASAGQELELGVVSDAWQAAGDLAEQVATLSRSLSQAAADRELLLAERDQLQESLTDLLAEIASNVASAESEREETDRKLLHAEASKKQAEERAELSLAATKQLEAERDQLRESLKDLLEETENQLARMVQLETERPELLAAANEGTIQRAENVALHRQLELRADVSRRREAILGARLLELSEDLGTLQAHAGGAERQQSAEIVRLREALDVATREKAELIQAAQAAQAEIEHILSTKSWRITEPLRKLRDLLSSSPS